MAEHKPPEEEDGNQLGRDPYSFFKKMVEVQIYANLYSMGTQYARNHPRLTGVNCRRQQRAALGAAAQSAAGLRARFLPPAQPSSQRGS